MTDNTHFLTPSPNFSGVGVGQKSGTVQTAQGSCIYVCNLGWRLISTLEPTYALCMYVYTGYLYIIREAKHPKIPGISQIPMQPHLPFCWSQCKLLIILFYLNYEDYVGRLFRKNGF